MAGKEQEPKQTTPKGLEIPVPKRKRLAEVLLRLGPIQVLERLSRIVLGRYFAGRIGPQSDVHLDPNHIKLHFHSHKKPILDIGSQAPA